jgi:putative aldouronate transport system permease protein
MIKKNLYRSRYLYLLIFLPVVYFIIFKYIPIYGIIIAFQDYKVYKGYFGSTWVGLSHFMSYLRDPSFWGLVKNTLLLSLWQIMVCFPIPIVFALVLNEMRSRRFKNFVQNVSYLPHFISVVVIVGMCSSFLRTDGLINDIVAAFGGTRHAFLLDTKWFRAVYVLSDLWATLGWSSIIYLAALAAVDTELYEAAVIDGAGRFAQILHVTIPSILPTITIMFILRMGSILNIGFEKVLLLQNPVTYEVSDVISTFVYRRGLQGSQYSYATAVDMFSSVINLVTLWGTNKLSKCVSDTSLW